MTRKITIWFIWIVGSIVIAFDIYMAMNGVYDDTISEITQAYSYRWSTIPTAYGVLTGHLFWPHRGTVEHRALRNVGIALLGVGVLACDLMDLWNVWPIIPVVIAIPLGRLLWPLSIDRTAAVISLR